MNITKIALEKTHLTALLIILIVISGSHAYYHMPRNEDPGFVVRRAVVVTFFPGAQPQQVEELLTDKLENHIQQIPQIDYIESTSKTGLSIIEVNIQEKYRNLRPIWDDLRRKVADITHELPKEIIGPFVDDEFGDVFGIVIMLTGEGYTLAELRDIADEVRDELLLIDDVAKVSVDGVQKEHIFIDFDNSRLAELGISTYQMQELLSSRNVISPSGKILSQHERILLQATGNFESIEDLKKTVIRLPGKNQVLYLQDLATIYRGYADPATEKATYNGQNALAISVNMRKGGNVLSLGKDVRDTIQTLQQMYPIGVEFNYVSYQPHQVKKKVNDFIINILQALGIVTAMMLITLGLRTGLVVTSLIPVTMITSILVMSFFKIGLDQVSLGSLIVSLGMLVDNAIVMSEAIMVQIANGKRPHQAALDAARELKIPLLTASLTTAAAFFPIYLAESTTGEYTAPIFKVVTITLLCSWVLTLTMIPLFCVRFLKIQRRRDTERFNSSFYRWYRGNLLRLLKKPGLSIMTTVMILIIALGMFRFIPVIFFPPDDKPIFSVSIELPTDTPIEDTGSVITSLEQFMQDTYLIRGQRKEGIINWASFVGRGAPRYVLNYHPQAPAPEVAHLLVNTTSLAMMKKEIIPTIEKFCLEQFPDITVVVKPLTIGEPIDHPIEIRIWGKSPGQILEITDTIKQKMIEMTPVKVIDDNWGKKNKKLIVDIDQPRALRAGITSKDVAISLQTIFSGIDIADYREKDKLIPITLRSKAADRKDISKLENHHIYVQTTGASLPLSQVADIQMQWQQPKILRYDRRPTVTIRAHLKENVNSISFAKKLDAWLQTKKSSWPQGVGYALGGEIEVSQKANRSILVKVPIAAMLILIILISQFNSIRKVLIILATIPLGIIGVVCGLTICKSYFGFMTLLGIVALSGIVVNNAIVLLDRIRIEIEENKIAPQKAIINAAQSRLRPIILTTATTVAGLLPLWLGSGPMWKPLAIAIIFGLSFSTILTLAVIPVLYSVFFNISFQNHSFSAEC